MNTERITEHCRWAQGHNAGHPDAARPAEEQVAVALALRDHNHLEVMGYTLEQAAAEVCEELRLTPFQLTGWLNDIRTEVGVG